MSSPAENAATVREAIDYYSGEAGIEVHPKDHALAALDALLAQAKTAEAALDREAGTSDALDDMRKRAEAAEARLAKAVTYCEEAERLYDKAEQRITAFEARLAQAEEALAERDANYHEERILKETAEARLAQAEEALRGYANPDNWDLEDGPPFVWVKDSDPPGFARAALAGDTSIYKE